MSSVSASLECWNVRTDGGVPTNRMHCTAPSSWQSDRYSSMYELHYIANKHRAVPAVEHAVVGLRDVALYLEVFQQSGPSDGRPPLQQYF